MPAEPYYAYRSIQQPYGHYHWRRLDFCEGDGGFVCVRFIWEDCKGECYTFTRKASATDTKKDKVPVLLSSLPNKTSLVTDSEDNSDAK